MKMKLGSECMLSYIHCSYNFNAHALMFMRCPGNKMAGAEEKEPENIVHRNAIFCETIRKEQSDQKLYTSYGVNPYKKSKQTCARSS